jgi:hypothetical protein
MDREEVMDSILFDAVICPFLGDGVSGPWGGDAPPHPIFDGDELWIMSNPWCINIVDLLLGG